MLAISAWWNGVRRATDLFPPNVPEDALHGEPLLAERLQTQTAISRERPTDSEAHGRLGILYEAHGYTALAIRCYENAIAASAANVRWRFHLAVLFAESGDRVSAERAFRSVIDDGPTCAPAHERLALLLLDRQAYEEAGRLFERVIKLKPGEAPGYLGLARAKLATHHEEEAIAWLSKAVKLDPESSEAHYLLSRAHHRLGHIDEAAEARVRVRTAEPTYLRDPWQDEVNSARLTWWARLQDAKLLITSGHTSEAAKRLEAIAADYPGNVRALNEIALAYIKLERREEAERLIARALEIRADYVPTHLTAAMLFADQGELTKALEHAEVAVRLAPTDARGWTAQGRISSKLGRHESALASLRKADQLGSSDPELLGDIAMALTHLGRWEDAIRAFTMVVAVNPRSAMDHCRLGLLYERVGRIDDGLTSLRTASRLDPTNATIRQALAHLEAKGGG